jgi:hypothetical protein
MSTDQFKALNVKLDAILKILAPKAAIAPPIVVEQSIAMKETTTEQTAPKKAAKAKIAVKRGKKK